MDDFEDFLSSEMATPQNVSSLPAGKPKSGYKDASFFLDEDLDLDTFLVGTSVRDVKLPTEKSSRPSGSAGIIRKRLRTATEIVSFCASHFFTSY